MRKGSTDALYRLVLIVAIGAVWLLLSFAQAVKIAGMTRGLAVCAGTLALAGFALAWVRGRGVRQTDGPRIVGWLAASWLLATIAYVILHLFSQRHVFGPGSDRENAIEIACGALLAGSFPYRQLTFLHHPITPMPGALLFAAPFYLMGQVGLENLAWLAVFFAWCYWIFEKSWWAVWFALCFVVFSPCIMQDFVTGGDFFTNFAYIVVLFSLVAVSLSHRQTSLSSWILPLLLGTSLASRPIYSLLYPCLFAYALQVAGRWTALRTLVLTLMAQLGVTLPIFLQDRAHFTPFNVGSMAVSLVPERFHAAPVTFALGLLVASGSLFVRLTIPRMLTIFGLAITVVTLPFFIVDRIVNPELFPLIDLIYLSPGLLLLVVWALQELRANTPVAEVEMIRS
jgi:hypothetical protein